MSTTLTVILWVYAILGIIMALIWWFGTPSDTTGKLDLKKFFAGFLFGIFWPVVVFFTLLRRD